MNDLKFALRWLFRNPGFTLVTVLTLGLGIGANTAIFSVINGLLLRPLPVRDPGKLVQVVSTTGAESSHSLSYPVYRTLAKEARGVTGLFAATGVDHTARLIVAMEAGEDAETIRAQPVSGNFFQVLGVSAAAGRTLSSTDDMEGAAQPVMVLSHGFWERRFGADPSIVGRTVKFEGLAFTIVGVAPRGFFGFQPDANPDAWWPLQMIPRIDQDTTGRRLRAGNDSYRLVGRLAPGFTQQQSEAEFQGIFKRYQEEQSGNASANAAAAPKIHLESARAGWTPLRRDLADPLTLLMAAVGMVLLIACANVGSLLLARGASRAREFSLRHALGARASRLIRQSLTESMVLAFMGGALGLLFAMGGTRLVAATIGDGLAFPTQPDFRVLVFTVAVTFLAGILFGLIPALRTSDSDVASRLKSGANSTATGSNQRWLQSLVVAQVALSLVLLVGAGLFVRTLQNLTRDTNPAWKDVVHFTIRPKVRFGPERQVAIMKQLLAELEASAGVESASLYLFGLLSGNGFTQTIFPSESTVGADDQWQSRGVFAGPRFFETLGVSVVRGRDFTTRDALPVGTTNIGAPRVLVINQSMARKYFGENNPLGKRLTIKEQPGKEFEIVGMVEDLKYGSLRESSPPTFYLPFFQEARGGPISFVVRTQTSAPGFIANLPSILGRVDGSLGLLVAKTMRDSVEDTVRQERLIAQLGSVFSFFALGLACVGLYGVLSFSVSRRTREIGVRMALGASRGEVLGLVLGRGLKMVLVGSLVGLAGSFATTRFASRLLYGVGAADPVTLGCVTLLLFVVTLGASWLPARRAARINPMEALRYE